VLFSQSLAAKACIYLGSRGVISLPILDSPL